jgi:hypothetical protein
MLRPDLWNNRVRPAAAALPELSLPRLGLFLLAARRFKTGHLHEEVNGGGGSPTYITPCRGHPRHPLKMTASGLGPFSFPNRGIACSDRQSVYQ